MQPLVLCGRHEARGTATFTTLAPIAIAACSRHQRRRRSAAAPVIEKLWAEPASAQLLAEIQAIGSGRSQCPICLDAYAPQDKLVVLDCTHVFHSGCIEKHRNAGIEKSALCPLCDRALQPRVRRTIDGAPHFEDDYFAVIPAAL